MQTSKPLSLPFYILALFYAPIVTPYLPKTNFGAGIPDFGFYEICLLLWFLTLLLDLSKFKTSMQSRIKLSSWGWILTFYTILVIASVAWSQESYSSKNISTLFFTMLIPLIIILVSRLYLNSDLIVAKIIKHAAFCSFWLSAISIVKFIVYKGKNLRDARSAVGGLGNPNGLAIFLVLSVPVIMYGIKKQYLSVKWGVVVLITIWGGVLGTISRKGIITLAVSYLIFLFLTKAYKLLMACILVLLLVAAVAFSNQYISQRFTHNKIEKEFTGKWIMAKAGVDMFIQKPVVGWGYKGYFNNFGHYFKYSVVKKYDAHNNYVTALANYGIIGIISFLGIFFIPLFKSLKYLKKRKNAPPDQRLRAVTLISFLIPFMMSAWFAGALMYKPVIINVLYLYIVIFSMVNWKRPSIVLS